MLLWFLCLMHPPLYENFNDKCKMAHVLHIHLPFALKHFGLRFGPFVKHLDQMFVHSFSPINMIPIVCFHYRNCIYIVKIVNFLPIVYHLDKCRGSNVIWRLKLSNTPLLRINMALGNAIIFNIFFVITLSTCFYSFHSLAEILNTSPNMCVYTITTFSPILSKTCLPPCSLRNSISNS